MSGVKQIIEDGNSENNKKFEVKGKLIVVEGTDGSGKSTQIHLLGRWLISEGFPVFMDGGRIGIIQSLRESAAERRVNVRILTPINNNMVEKIAQNTVMADQAKNNFFDIQAIETTSSPEIAVVGTVTILVVDRKQSLVIEKTDDSKEDFIDAVGLAIYSTSKPTVLSYISIFDSLSKQVKLYEELKTHGKMQEEFINVASHELRTPTQSVLAYSELLRRHPERRDEMIQAIYRNAERLQRLTNDILDVTGLRAKL